MSGLDAVMLALVYLAIGSIYAMGLGGAVWLVLWPLRVLEAVLEVVVGLTLRVFR